MALTGLEIYKHLPKKNCKECGLPTCLAFAMKVAAGQAGLDECPELDSSAVATLNEASAPPQRLVTVGKGDTAVTIGQETVLFRHEDKFYHPCGLAVRVPDTLDEAALSARLADIAKLSFDRMGRTFAIDMIAVEGASGDAAKLAACAKAVAAGSDKALVLISADAAALKTAGQAVAARSPLLHYAGPADGFDAAVAAAKELKLPLGIQADSAEALAELSEKARAAGLQDLVLSPGAEADPTATLELLTTTRRAALQKKFRPLGFPVMAMALGDGDEALLAACQYVLKYAGIVVVDTVDPLAAIALLTTRFNISTDPQKPVQVEPKLYEVNTPGADDPVLVTTNFALSYYSVEGEVEASRMPAWIIAVDTEGTSVLTAWAADKFNAETITAALQKSGIEERVSHRQVTLPGHVAVISGGLEDESGWKVDVGPKEAVGLNAYLKNRRKTA